MQSTLELTWPRVWPKPPDLAAAKDENEEAVLDRFARYERHPWEEVNRSDICAVCGGGQDAGPFVDCDRCRVGTLGSAAVYLFLFAPYLII